MLLGQAFEPARLTRIVVDAKIVENEGGSGGQGRTQANGSQEAVLDIDDRQRSRRRGFSETRRAAGIPDKDPPLFCLGELDCLVGALLELRCFPALQEGRDRLSFQR